MLKPTTFFFLLKFSSSPLKNHLRPQGTAPPPILDPSPRSTLGPLLSRSICLISLSLSCLTTTCLKARGRQGRYREKEKRRKNPSFLSALLQTSSLILRQNFPSTSSSSSHRRTNVERTDEQTERRRLLILRRRRRRPPPRIFRSNGPSPSTP